MKNNFNLFSVDLFKISSEKILRLSRLFLILFSCGFVIGCGGGGGGPATPVASTDTFPLAIIFANSLQSSSSPFSISGSVNGVSVSGSGTVTRGSLRSGTFEGVTAQQRTVTATGSFSVNGISYSLNNSSVDWFDPNYLPLGETGGADYVVVTGVPVIPANVRVNDTGTLYTANRYSSSAKTLLRGTETVTYVVEADTASTALLTLITTEKDNFNSTISTYSSQVRITPTGGFARIKETGVEGNTTLTITY